MRLPDYDYASAGAYFITICTRDKALSFADLKVAEVVEWAWRALPAHFPRAMTDAFVVMPNHIHGVIWILDNRQGMEARVGPRNRLAAGSLGVIVRSFRSAVTKRVNELRGIPGEPVWQRNYYERIVRNDDELNHIREYIQLNPQKWNLDRDNPVRVADEHWDAQLAWLEAEQPWD